MEPLVTIGVPTFNRAGYLRRALESALGQTHGNLEIIVSDNASTDDTPQVGHAFEKKDARLRYVRQRENVGPIANYQFLLDQARGKYFMWHADDDAYHPRFVARTAAHLEQDASAALCFCDFREVDEEGHVRQETRLEHLRPEQPWPQARRDFFRYPFQRSAVAIYGLYRTEALRKVGGPRPALGNLLVGVEMPFLARVARRGRVVALPEFLFDYNNHAIQKASSAHESTRALRPWQKGALFAAIQLRLLTTALAVPAPLQERLALVGEVMGATARRMTGRPTPS